MKKTIIVTTLLFNFACLGCGSRDQTSPKNTNPQPAIAPRQNVGRKPFLDQKKQVPARLDWSREITTKRGGNISFRITSQGPFTAMLVTDKMYQAIRWNSGDTILNSTYRRFRAS
jgi:hypothetical protein